MKAKRGETRKSGRMRRTFKGLATKALDIGSRLPAKPFSRSQNTRSYIAHPEILTFKIEEALFRPKIRENPAIFNKILNSLKIKNLRAMATPLENANSERVRHYICSNPVISLK